MDTIETVLVLSLTGYAVALLGARTSWKVWICGLLLGTGSGLLLAGIALLNGHEWIWESSWQLGGEALRLRLDALSGVFLALLSFAMGLGGIYSLGYWNEKEHPASARSGRIWWTLLAASMELIVLCANGLHFLIAWEVFAIAAFFLISLDRKNPQARKAAWLYMAASHMGTMLLFLFFAGLASRVGSWALNPMRGDLGAAPLFWLALFGFGVKAGLFPLHIWLPTAHANSPSHVSAAMSGVALKMGVYGILRFGGWLPVSSSQALTVIGLGVLGAVLGILFALVQSDYKRLLAYCSVENVGVILIAAGLGFLGAANGQAAWGKLAFAGALFHVWNHGLFKTLLFFGSGSLLHATGTRDMSRLGGLWRSMPWTFAFMGIGAAAVSSVPPLNGFASEWLVYMGAFKLGSSGGSWAWAGLPAALGLALAGALALAAFLKFCAITFMGTARSTATRNAHEAGPSMRFGMAVAAAGCVLLGLFPQVAWAGIENAVTAWGGYAAEASSGAQRLQALSGFNLFLTAGLLLAAFVILRKAKGRKSGPTWGCGYAAPSERMQYTAGAFSEITQGWGRGILRPRVSESRPSGLFPSSSFWRQRVPETVLETIVEPTASSLYWLARHARRLQHGRLQFYILYFAIGLAALSWVAWLSLSTN